MSAATVHAEPLPTTVPSQGPPGTPLPFLLPLSAPQRSGRCPPNWTLTLTPGLPSRPSSQRRPERLLSASDRTSRDSPQARICSVDSCSLPPLPQRSSSRGHGPAGLWAPPGRSPPGPRRLGRSPGARPGWCSARSRRALFGPARRRGRGRSLRARGGDLSGPARRARKPPVGRTFSALRTAAACAATAAAGPTRTRGRLQLLLLGGARGSDRSGAKPQSGRLEKACGPSLDRTVQKCPLPCPALAQTKIPGLAAPLSATGRGWTLPALEGQLGSSAWVGQKEGGGSSGGNFRPPALQTKETSPPARMGEFGEKTTTCGTVCLKYLLFTFNCCFWLAGLAVMAVGIWTLALKSDYISLLASGTYLATAYILVVAGAVVMVTGVLGCCATFKERRDLLRLVSRSCECPHPSWAYRGKTPGSEHLGSWRPPSACLLPGALTYFTLLLVIFLLEIIAGALAYVYYQQLNAELKENLKDTMTKRYHQLGHEGVTSAVDKLQQEFHCCGSNNSQDWRDSEWIRSGEAGGRVVPDSCCKTVVAGCGQRDHASNIYKVEGGCITKLETFIQEHLRIIGAVGLGIACVQVFGMIFTCCLYKSLKLEHY
ncbi:hypothetical protein EI555_019040 [Monodon monoceros]|uniref:Uncharacterized protein n=1 Tax=Monodon monoceros TaxID=40151 RepID=A0A4U1EML6_MONMO|nr:hypothetical protein EI555_019040 [Monodon monoceros]